MEKGIENQIFVTYKLRNCLKMDLRGVYTSQFLADLTLVVMAEWSKASEYFRSFGQNLRWGPGFKKIFFSIFAFLHSLDCQRHLILYYIQIWWKINKSDTPY